MNAYQDILDGISLHRMVDDLWRLVNIPSPTRQERRAALAFAEMLADAGAEVELDETIHDSPSVIGRLKGKRPGRTFQLAGHMDHIDVPHPAPERDGETIRARGASDMKDGLAGILETVRVLKETGCDFPGEVLVTAYGLHEAPLGDGRGLLNLIERDVVGDAALVAESTHAAYGKAVVQGKGQAIWTATLRWDGPSSHELNRPDRADGLLDTAMALIQALRRLEGELKAKEVTCPLLGPESVFIGQIHCGDFYNRVATECTIQGTRRWTPDHPSQNVEAEFSDLIPTVPCPEDVSVEIDWMGVGEAFQVDPEESVVQALRAAHRTVTGSTMDLAGISAITDANRLVGIGGVPTVLCGFDNRTAHADREEVRVENLLEPCRLVLFTVLETLERLSPNSAGNGKASAAHSL